MSRFVWPTAETLIRRAERELNLAPQPQQSAPVADTIDRFAELEARLYRYEVSYPALHPVGYDSGGRLAPAKVVLKKVSRRLMWWYVEPRWTVHREMTANLVGFSHEAIEVLRTMSAEIEELRARIGEQEELARPTVAAPTDELGG